MNISYRMKLISRLFFLATLAVATPALFAQADSDVLFSVGDSDVTVGEFKYIYSKSNGEEADFSKQSVQEYLDLYERFKLKVVKAREMGLDTVTALQDELEGYRRQLADNYIIDRQVTDRLVSDLYERRRQDVEFSHVFLQFDGNPTPADTLALYERAATIMRDLTPENFEETAGQISEDPSSKAKGGYVGYVSPPFPNGLARLEAALYEAPAGRVIGPIQSQYGYHLAFKHGSRPALGEIEIGHILVRKPEDTTRTATAVDKINAAKAALNAGDDFARVAKEYSEDNDTKNNAGYLGFFGINTYDPDFEAAAFGLEEDGAVSDIVESKVGYHLIRRISHRGLPPFNDVRPLLENKVKSDNRFLHAKDDLLADLRITSGLTENTDALDSLVNTYDPERFVSAQWTPSDVKGKATLWTMEGGRRGTVADFEAYLVKNNRQRMGLARTAGATPTTIAGRLYNNWLDEQLMEHAESRLEKDFPEFAALMREYREGILLFEATKMEVWDKASQDTTGLLSFYEKRREEYQWGPRATVSRYVINTKEDIDVNAVVDFARTQDAEATIGKFGEAVTVQTDAYEYDRMEDIEDMEGLKPEAGSTSMLKNDLRAGTATFYKVEDLLPAGPKQLEDARGYVIADYQDELERRWVEELRNQYPVRINKRVLNKMIQ